MFVKTSSFQVFPKSYHLSYSINANYWDVKNECIEMRAAIDDGLRYKINSKLTELRVHPSSELLSYFSGKVIIKSIFVSDILRVCLGHFCLVLDIF